jgi:hypothetical protein
VEAAELMNDETKRPDGQRPAKPTALNPMGG